MSAAALTPRVRILAVCDEAVGSEIEAGVFTLEGVRHQIFARSFPCLRELSVYLLLSYPRVGRFEGRIRVEDDEENKFLRLKKFDVELDEATQVVALDVELGECVFPASKVYAIRVHFTSRAGVEVLKYETSFSVVEEPE